VVALDLAHGERNQLPYQIIRPFPNNSIRSLNRFLYLYVTIKQRSTFLCGAYFKLNRKKDPDYENRLD
jgi:hypothetical protein